MFYLLVQLGSILADKAVYQNYGEFGNLLSNPYSDSMDSIVNNPDNSSGLLDLLSGTIDLPNNAISMDESKNQSNLQKSSLKEHDETSSSKSMLHGHNSAKMTDDSSDDESQKSEKQKSDLANKKGDKKDADNMSDSEDD